MSLGPASRLEEVEFVLTRLPVPGGRIEIRLTLCRGERIESETTISTAPEGEADLILAASRCHLRTLGLNERLPRLPRAADLDTVGRAA